MLKLTEFYDQIINVAKSTMQQRNISNAEAASKYKLGGTLSTEEANYAKDVIVSIESAVDETVNTVLGHNKLSEEHNFTTAQLQAAKMVAAIAQNPRLYREKMGSLALNKENFPVVSAEAMGVDDIVSADAFRQSLSLEAYDGQKLQNAVYFAIAYNLGAARQDAFGEAFFPTVTIDPAQSGVHVSIEYTSLMQEFSRSISGGPDKDKFKKIPVVKALYDNSIFATDKNKLVPVYRENDNKDKFVDSEQHLDKSTGKDIVTAPLKFGIAVSLLGISQTDELLAKGTMDNTDALDRTINLEKVYYSLTNTDGSKSEIFSFEARTFPYYGFTYAPQEHNKDMVIRFTNKNLRINVSEIKTAKGAASELFKNVATNYANHVAILEFNIQGQANTQDSDIEIFGNKLALVEVRNAADEVVAPTEQAYKDIAEVVAKAKLEGYTIEAYRTNSNIRTRGRIVTNDRWGQEYNVPLRAGITAVVPVNNFTGDDNDAAAVTSQIQLAGVITSAYAVNTLVNFAAAMNNSALNGSIESSSFQGIGRFLVNPWFRDTTFDLASIVDSTQSAHRDEDIRSALRLKIKNEVMDMYTYSNYGAAFEITRGNLGGKIGVIIGTDPTLKNLLCKDDAVFSLGENFEAHVVSTLNPLVAGKIFITFGLFDGDDRNSAINPLNFGNCAWAPTIAFEVNKNDGSAYNRELHNNPRFLHLIHLPILSVYNISDVKGVFSKIPVHAKSV